MGTNEVKLKYAKDTFENVQALIRLMDAKASFSLVVIGIVVTEYIFVLKASFDGGIPKVIEVMLLILAACFFYYIYRTIVYAMECLNPRSHPKSGVPLGQKLLFPLMILEAYGSDKAFHEALVRTNDSELLKEYSNQIFINSAIYREKFKNAKLCLNNLKICLGIWIVSNAAFIIGFLFAVVGQAIHCSR